MVILQFTKLIRNKWVWGAFAVVISAAFCFDDLFTTRQREERNLGDAGKLGAEAVDAKLFAELQQDVRGLGRSSDWRRKQSEVNEQAWETYAAMQTAEELGLTCPDSEVMATIRRDRTFAPNGAFSFRLYQQILRENSVLPERFEAFLKRRLTLQRIGDTVLGSADWVSPMELGRVSADFTDLLTVKVARFAEDKDAAAQIVADDAAIEKWYGENTKSLELPERVKLRMVKYDATNPDVLAKMTVTEDEMRDLYDTTLDKYTTTDTNGVETVKTFEEVKDGIEKELRQIAAVDYFTTNLNQRIYQPGATLDSIAQEDNAEITVSDWFSTDGGYQEGFMKYAFQIAPGAKAFNEAVAELDPSSPDLRYGVVSSANAVWVIERADSSPAHTPTLEEAREAIRPRVTRALKADAFKAQVEAVIAAGKEAVLASGNVSTNLTFAVCDLKPGDFDDMEAISKAASKLEKDQMSGFTLTGTGKALVVVCENREPGDVAKATLMAAQLREDAAMPAKAQLPQLWLKWNLARIGFEPGETNPVAEEETDEEIQ